ncbi:hypothetical protein [Streptomyces sp. ML-6]|uniref:hypothetical protein n=1 Tax=Streptomyces sp. ML-6 TaxID=2982693 RepID=UPI0024BFA7D4|nr:hypothetical protein [Streptomyces sp. ML-6]MDK0524218.1 hypothetical protein [Streptomyces sp. ML-6]
MAGSPGVQALVHETVMLSAWQESGDDLNFLAAEQGAPDGLRGDLGRPAATVPRPPREAGPDPAAS